MEQVKKEALNTVEASEYNALLLSSRLEGISKLSDDILSYIMQFILDLLFSCDDYWIDNIFSCYTKTVLSLSQVSKRFRDIALDTPILWSRIYVHYSRSFPWRLFLERSRNVPLYVWWIGSMHGYMDRDQRRHELLTPLFRQLGHWKELRVQGDCHNFFRYYKELMTTIGSPVPEGHKYTSSGMLALDHLVSNGSTCLDYTTSSLVFCKLRHINVGRPNELECDIMAFLATCKALECLELDDLEVADFPVLHCPVELPSLTSFALTPDDSAETSAVKSFFRLFRMPKLKKLSINRPGRGWNSSLDGLFDHLEFKDNVQSIELHVAPRSIRHPVPIPFKSIARNFSNLSEVIIWSDSSHAAELQECEMSALRTFTIRVKKSWTHKRTIEDILIFLRNRRKYANGRDGFRPLRVIMYDYEVMKYSEDLRMVVAEGLVDLELYHNFWSSRDTTYRLVDL